MRARYSSKPDVAVPVLVSLEVEGDPEPTTGWITRLSLAGVDIESLRAPPVGSRIAFYTTLEPDSSEVLAFTGRVRWVAGGRVGVQFTELGAKETYAIVRAMRK